MKKLVLSLLILLSMYNYSVTDDIQEIPMVVLLSVNEASVIDFNEEAIEGVIYHEVAEFYSIRC